MIQTTKAKTMPIGIVIHSGPRPKPRAVAAKSSAGRDREAGERQEQHLRGQTADDPEHRAEVLLLALREIAAHALRSPSRSPSTNSAAAIT